MYIKFFGNKSGGSKGSVNYLLNEKRVEDGTAKILKGSPEFTKAIIGEIKTKHKVCFGSINLKEGEKLTLQEKEKVMADFEKTLMPGLEENQYNILWVEHTDKGRLELNFVIPKIELTTQKSFNPYFHKADFNRIDLFEDIQNIKYNLESKKDPANSQTLRGNKKEINLVKDYIELDKTLHQLVQSRDIQNREQMVSLLKNSGIEITRSNKEGISVKLPESKKAHRLKGGIYDEQFTSVGEFKKISERTDGRIKEFQSRNTSRELELTLKKLDGANDQKARFNREKYHLKDEPSRKAEQVQIQLKSPDNNNQRELDNRDIIRPDINRVHPEIQRVGRVESSTKNEIYREWQKIHNESKNNKGNGQQDHVYRIGGIEENDTRTATFRRIRERAEAKREAYAEARQARTELYKTVTEQSRELRKQSKLDCAKLSGQYATVTEQSRELVNRAEEVGKESESSIRFAHEFERTGSKITTAYNACVDYIKDAREYLKGKYNQLIRGYNELPHKLQETTKLIQETSKEAKPEISFADVERVRISLNKSVDFSNEKVQSQRSQSRGYSLSR